MYKQLMRSRENKILGGVCGGFGEYFETDPLLFRIIFLVLLFIAGGGFLLYMILWIILPQKLTMYEQPYKDNNTIVNEPEVQKKKNNGSVLAGIILIFLGVVFLLNYYVTWLKIAKLWPLILVAIGIILIGNYMSSNKQKENNHEER